MNRIGKIAANAVLCATGLVLLIETVQGHRIETILLRGSLTILAAGTLALAFLAAVRRFRTSAPSRDGRQPAASDAKPAQTGR